MGPNGKTDDLRGPGPSGRAGALVGAGLSGGAGNHTAVGLHVLLTSLSTFSNISECMHSDIFLQFHQQNPDGCDFFSSQNCASRMSSTANKVIADLKKKHRIRTFSCYFVRLAITYFSS